MFVNKLKQLPVGRLVLFMFGTLCAILLATGALFYFSVRSIERSNQMQQSSALNKLALIDDTAQDVGQIQAGTLRLIIASDIEEEKTLDRTVREIETINTSKLADYQKFIDTDKERRLYDRVMQMQKAYWEQTQPVLALGRDNRDSEAINLINSKQAPAYDEFLKAINELITFVATDAKETTGATTRFVSKTRIRGDVFIGMAILIAIGTGFAVAGISQRLKEDNSSLQVEVTERKRAEEELKWKTAFLEAQVNSSIDGILVVDEHGKKILQNQRFADLLRIPPHVAEDKDDRPQLNWVTGIVKNPDQFIEKVRYLNSHPDEISRDEIELNAGAVLDRYSSPVTGNNGKYYGRIWTFRDITEARRVEHELKEAKIAAVLREGEQSYNFLADTVPLVIWTARPDGGLDYYNKEWFDYTGLTLEQTKDWGWDAAIHPDDLSSCIEGWLRSLATGEMYEFKYRFKRGADGTYRWFLGRASPRRNEKGEIVQWVGTCTDIEDQKRAEDELRQTQSLLEDRVIERTAALAESNEALHAENVERKRTEDALRESNEKFHQLANNITDAFWIRSSDMSEVHYISPAFERIWGRTVESLYANPKQWADFIMPEDRERVVSAFAMLTGDAAGLDIEYRIVRPDGAIRWIRVRSFQVRDGADKLIRHTGIVTDITDGKHAEASRDRLVAILEATPDLVSIYDPDGNLTYLNRAGRRILGVGMDEDITKTRIADFIPEPASHPILTVGIPSAVRQGIWSGETMLLSRFGHGFLVSQVIISHKSPEGKIEFLSTIMRDMTQRKKEEAQLFQSQKMETVGKLAGGIAHEFNSIMTAIIGQSELLLNDLPPGDLLCANANEIHIAAERAAILTRQLLAYGRKQILQPEIIDLNSILTRMETTLRHLVGVGTDVRIVRTTGLKTVKADAGQIEQVIMNMVMNAVDAMPHGGKLTLETANVTLDGEYVSRFPDLKTGEYVMLAITDTGTGISEKVKSRVFEPFFSTKPVGQGTGLGLSTCYGIIKQSGGHIGVYSEPARGTTFKVYLPQVERQAHVPVPRLHDADLPRGTETILLVDDDPALRMMAATLLRRLGYTVLVAADGVEALDLKKQGGTGYVDLLFTDVVMPHMSGKELADRVSALYPHTRILYTSAYTENAIVHQGVLDKGIALLQKPFTPSALAHKLREVLDEVKAG